MKESKGYWAIMGVIVALCLVFLLYGVVKKRSGSLRRWSIQELLLVCMVVSFGTTCTTALRDRDAMAEVYAVWMMGAMILAFGTVLISWQVFREGKRMQKLVRTFTAALKGTGWMEEKPLYLDREMEALWNGARVLAREIERLKYQQLSQQRMYSRLIPRAAECLFEQKELSNVSAGDYVWKAGIIGCISVQTDFLGGREGYQNVKNQISDVFLKVQEEGKSIFFPQSADLKKMWGIFLKGAESAVHTGVRLIAGMEEKKLPCDITMLLYPSDYTYGLTGNTSRVLPYFFADHGDELLFYAERLRKLGVKIAVTEEMAGQETQMGMSLRGIGYIEVSGENRNLYEVLEAYPAAKRRSIERQAGKFKKALELYYGSDFYLARNLFAEVLKECPKDDVAKWYLFACETRLGSVKSTEAGYGLFADV